MTTPGSRTYAARVARLISISQLYCGAPSPGRDLRYGPAAHARPVVVWNLTRRCNLRCLHCYSNSENKRYPGELTSEEAAALLRGLADYGVPALLLSGGEPLLRRDVFDLASLAGDLGIRVALSTNGTLITRQTARRLRQAGFFYVGVSLDGGPSANDALRQVKGAFEAALQGLRNAKAEGLTVGLRFTVTRNNANELPAVFDLAEAEGVHRFCIYHLVYAGRAAATRGLDLPLEKKRRLVDFILAKAEEFSLRNLDTEILTVNNHADGPYLYRKLKERGRRASAERALRMLKLNGGNSSGVGIACVDSYGFVHPDQFWTHYSLGNVRERAFADIWDDEAEPLLAGLRSRKERLKGRCASCPFLELCNGNMRVRAEAVYGDIWAPDPACYLTEEEFTSKPG